MKYDEHFCELKNEAECEEEIDSSMSNYEEELGLKFKE